MECPFCFIDGLVERELIQHVHNKHRKLQHTFRLPSAMPAQFVPRPAGEFPGVDIDAVHRTWHKTADIALA